MKRNNSGPFSSEPIRITTLVLLLTVVLSLRSLAGGAQSPTQQEDNTLSAAIAAGKVTAQFTGMGSSSGDAVRVTVQNTAAAGPGTLTLTIPPGTMLRSSNPSEQNMVIAGVRGRQIDAQRFTPQSQIVLTGTAAATYVLEAYCAEFHKGNPSATTGFLLGTSAPLLSAILTEGKKRNLSTRALQAAIWIATDNVSYDEVNVRFPLSPSEWESGKQQVKPAIGLRAPQQRTPLGGQSLPASSRGYEIEVVPPGESLPIIGSRSPVGTTVQVGGEAILTDDQLKLVGEWIASCSKRFGKTVKEPRIMEQLVGEFVHLVGFEKASKAGLIFFGSEGSSDYRWPAVAKKPTGGPNSFPVKAEGKTPKLLSPKVGQELEDALTNVEVKINLTGPIGNMRTKAEMKARISYRLLTDLDAGTDKDGKLILRFPEGGRVQLLADGDFGETHIRKDSILTKTKEGWMCEEPGAVATATPSVPANPAPPAPTVLQGTNPSGGRPTNSRSKEGLVSLGDLISRRQLSDSLAGTTVAASVLLDGRLVGSKDAKGDWRSYLTGSVKTIDKDGKPIAVPVALELRQGGEIDESGIEQAGFDVLSVSRPTEITGVYSGLARILTMRVNPSDPEDYLVLRNCRMRDRKSAAQGVEASGKTSERPGRNAAASANAPTHPAPVAAAVLQGTNPNGDTILWDSGKTWKGVTISGLERKSTGTLLAIKDTPPGFPGGKYFGFKEVALRGAQLPAPAVENPIDGTRLYSPGYTPQGNPNPAPFAPYDDAFFTKWWGVAQWDSLAVKPENAAPVQNQDGVKVLAQFKVTITHIAVKDGNCYLLVRRNAGQMLPEGWCYNIDEAIFQREPPGTKR